MFNKLILIFILISCIASSVNAANENLTSFLRQDGDYIIHEENLSSEKTLELGVHAVNTVWSSNGTQIFTQLVYEVPVSVSFSKLHI